MAARPAGPDPPTITADDVRNWLAVAFMLLPNTPIYSVKKNAGQILDENVATGSTMDWVSFSAEVLGRGSEARLWLFTWARVEARRRIEGKRRRLIRQGRYEALRALPEPPAGGSVQDFCDEFDVDRSTFDRTVARACKQVAAAASARTKGTRAINLDPARQG